MAMLKRRKMIQALLHEMSQIAAYAARVKESIQIQLLNQVSHLSRQLGMYDNIIERIKIGGLA